MTHLRLLQLDLVGPAPAVPEGHPVEDRAQLRQLRLYLQQFEIGLVDAVGPADELLVGLEQLDVVLFDGNAVVVSVALALLH